MIGFRRQACAHGLAEGKATIRQQEGKAAICQQDVLSARGK
jgi:hypothetical protein